MYKIATTALMGFLLVGCTKPAGKESDWLESNSACEEYFSETPYDLKTCKNYLEEKKTANLPIAKSSLEKEKVPVTTTITGTEVRTNEDIKNYPTTQRDEIDN